MKKSNEQIAMRVSLVGIVGNIVLSAFKLFAGLLASSAAMVSDAVHSLSDVLSTGIVMIGVKLSNKSPDAEHQYGHERFESIAAILLAALLFATGLGIGWSGIEKIRQAGAAHEAPGLLALVAAAVSIAVKEAMYWYTRRAARRIDSSVLMASAWHHRSDALSSVGSFAGILGARLGMPIFDPVAAVIICVFILKAAVDIFRDAAGRMTDRACDDETARTLRDTALAIEDVIRVDQLKTRIFGDRIYVDLEIGVDATASLLHAHDIAQQVHDAIEAAFPKVKHCMVHVNPVCKDDEIC